METSKEDVAQVTGELRRDFEGTCVAIASELATCDDPTHWLDLLVVLAEEGDTGLSQESTERLVMDFLPQVIQLLLGKSFALTAVERVNKFFQWTLANVHKGLTRGEISRLACLARILDAHRRFYLYHGASNDGSGLNQEDEDEEGGSENQQTLRFTLRERSEYTSRYFMRNLEYWGQVGGFSVFLDVLRVGESFEVLQCVLRTLYDVKDHLSPEFLLAYFPNLVDAVCALVRKLPSAEFYALSRESLLEVVQVMELVLVKIQHEIDALPRDEQVTKSQGERNDDDLRAREVCEQRVQLLRLEISLRFFQSSSLEKRIYGVTEIVVTITRLYNEQIQEQIEPTAASLYATLSYLVNWMHEKLLMQELLGEKMHVELIKRSTSLFQFASELEVLPTEWIDFVWNCYHADTDDEEESRPVQRRHEAFRSTIHDLLLEMVTFMELPSLIHLVRRIEAVKAKLDSNQLGLLAAIATRRLLVDECLELLDDDNLISSSDAPHHRSLRQQILMHLWKFVLPSTKSEDFRDEVLLRMHEMLRLEAVGEDGGEEAEVDRCAKSCSMVDNFIGLCVDNISRRENLAISLKLFTQLSSLIAEVGIPVSNPQQGNSSYVRTLLNETVKYKLGVGEALKASEWHQIDDDERAKLPMLKDHVNETKNRLLALRAAWIMDECGVDKESSFTEKQLDTVWELMVVDAFLLDEAALCFQWIELCMNTPMQARASNVEIENARSPRALMPLSIAEYLLTTKFPTLPGDCITLSTLCCFHSIFRRINLLKGGLEIFTTAGDSSQISSPTGRASSGSSSDGDKEESVELMTGQPLVGLDELWQLAVRATDSAVAEEIITLLASFHLAFAPSVRQTELPFQCKMRFLEKCMEFIATAKADAELPPTTDQMGSGDDSYRSKLTADVAVVNRCVDLLRYFLEACKVGDDSAAKEEEEAILQKLEREGVAASIGASDNSVAARRKAFRLEQLEERLQYLEIYPSPMKDTQNRTGRRPSWTFRQHHARLDAIVDTNEEMEDTEAAKGEVPLPRRRLNSPARRQCEAESSPLKIDLLRTGSPVKPNMRSPGVRADLRSPHAPSPQRGPNFKPEDIDQALTDFTFGDRELYTKKDKEHSRSTLEDKQCDADIVKTKYGVMSQILANQDSHFDVLLELVDWNETTSQRTWDLLCRLPTNNELLRKMIRLRPVGKDQEEVNWSKLLDRSNIHRLLYALRLVEALLIPIDATASSDRELNSGRRQWRERFVRLGGARHLYETLLMWPDDAPGAEDSISSQYVQNIRATCLAAVMRVLNYFFYWCRRSAAEKAQLDKVSPFDLRLQTSTLPEFVNSIELPAMLQVAVQLTGKFCSRGSQNAASFSEEAAEAVYCGVHMCCSLIRFAPHLTTTVFEPDPESNSDKLGPHPQISMAGWLKALLVECPSKSTRVLVFGVLSEMATIVGVVDPARAPFEPLVISACHLVSDASLSAAYDYAALEELFTFCRVLLGCCERVRTVKGAGPEHNSGAKEALAATLIQKQIPGRLVRNLFQISSQRQSSLARRGIRAPKNQEEGILGGYLQLLALLAGISEKIRTTILKYDPKSSCDKDSGDSGKMIRFFHNELLFGDRVGDLDTPRPPICRTSSTRSLAQRLLLNLVFPTTSDQQSDCENISLNDDMLLFLSHHRTFQLRVLQTVNLAGRQWNHSPADSFMDASMNTHHTGLVNPGCICYMNSLVQQLFMMPEFCGGLLALDCSRIVADRSSSSWKEEVEQLQKLFVSLAYSNYRSIDPTTFALSHKDMDGNSTDVHIQMDADEFFSLLLDRLEMFIRPKPATDRAAEACKSEHENDFMAQCFGGVLVNQILTHQGNLSEREEKFFALSLEVSKKRHLAESLELYVQGETLEGENAYFCERVQRKVSATKRVCIKKLPRTLVCHLKRFEFDYDAMEKMKINDYLEFPMEIDMFPYTSEALTARDSAASAGRDEEAIMYDLVGVVVHSGTSDTGHYYSFIKDMHEMGSHKWLEFNDEVVREFDVETMGEECFGGEEVAQKWDASQGTYSPIVQMKRRSAYMLLYERRPLDEQPSSTTEVEIAAGTIPISSPVQALATQIMQENVRYEGVVNAFDPTYEQFIRDVMDNVTALSAEVARRACQLGCRYLFGINSLRCRPTAITSPVPLQSNVSTSHYQISDCVMLWLSSYGKNPSDDSDDELVQFCQWTLAEVVASPTSSLGMSSSAALRHVESQRTWLFDILFLSAGGQELEDSCFQVLLAAISVLTREATAKNTEAEQSLVDFFRESLNMFYSREPHLDVSDPASGCVLTLSMDTRVRAMKRLGVFFDQCISESSGSSTARTSTDLDTIRRLFLENLQFLNHFLLTLQTPCEPSDISSISRGIAPLAIETRSAIPMRELDLRFCTFQLETRLLKHLLETYEHPESLPLDTSLLLSHAALKNVVLFGLGGIVLTILTHVIFESEASSSKSDRLVALLIGVLEEVKGSHAEEVLAVFGRLLDEENERSKTVNDASSSSWTFHRHVFSPTRGVLESATYYRDHGSREYTLLLLEFVVRRASASPVLQSLFKSDPTFRKSARWIPGWLADHLDSNGAIRRRMHESDTNDQDDESTQGVEEVEKLFIEVEKVFGVPAPVFCEDTAHDEEQQPLISPPGSPSAISAEDIILQALELEGENQDGKNHRSTKNRSRRLGKSAKDEIGPEHEDTEADAQPDWKLHRSREDLSMLLRIDLDTAHNNAREA